LLASDYWHPRLAITCSIGTSEQCTRRKILKVRAASACIVLVNPHCSQPAEAAESDSLDAHAITLFKHSLSTGQYIFTYGHNNAQSRYEKSKDGMRSRPTRLSRSGTIIPVLWVHAGRCRLHGSAIAFKLSSATCRVLVPVTPTKQPIKSHRVRKAGQYHCHVRRHPCSLAECGVTNPM
jgi:hypothetical protein